MKIDPSAMTVRFSTLGHFYAHLFMLLSPTVVLALETEFQLSFDHLPALATPGFLLFGLGAVPAGWLGDRRSALGMMAVFFFGTAAQPSPAPASGG